MSCTECSHCNPKENRTSQQNRALHLWFRLLAEGLEDAGYDIQKTLNSAVNIPWSEKMVKELLWRPVQKIYLSKTSTKSLRKKEDIDNVFRIVSREISNRTGVFVDFPSMEQLMLEEESKIK